MAARIEEAKTTARLLLQTIQSTPSNELLANDLVREFADRAAAAHRSIQSYMKSEDPAPDEDTMLTLIETTEQLNIAMSKHQRALLQARKAMGLGTPSPQPQREPNQNPFTAPPPDQRNAVNPPTSAYNHVTKPTPPDPGPTTTYQPPPGPPPAAMGAMRSHDYAYRSPSSKLRPPPPGPAKPAGPATSTADYGVGDNPFSDANAAVDRAPAAPAPQKGGYSLFGSAPNPRTATPPTTTTTTTATTTTTMLPERQPIAYVQQPTPGYASRPDGGANHLSMSMYSASPSPPLPSPGDADSQEGRRGPMQS